MNTHLKINVLYWHSWLHKESLTFIISFNTKTILLLKKFLQTIKNGSSHRAYILFKFSTKSFYEELKTVLLGITVKTTFWFFLTVFWFVFLGEYGTADVILNFICTISKINLKKAKTLMFQSQNLRKKLGCEGKMEKCLELSRLLT